MFPSFLPSEVKDLSEPTSIAFARKIECDGILTPLNSEAIVTTYVRQGDDRTPILLLHGFDSSLLEFRRLFFPLAEKNETWAVDLLGFGFTQRPAGIALTPMAIETHLYYFWKTLIGKPVILVGASMGGAVAINFTLAHPEVVEKLVLIDSAGLAKPPIAGKFMFSPLDRLATAFLRNPKVRRNISRAAYYDKSLVTLDAQLCTALHLYCPDWDKALIAFTKSGGYGSFADKLPQIEQDTLILWGKNDKILGIRDAYRFHRAIANSKLVWLENCGHVPHLEKPQHTAKAILDFR
jgi:pimeloyl-ACP methyl ester carboxylesterase